jgi:hypothetical protein
MIERVIHGNRSHIYRDMLAWCSKKSHEKDVERQMVEIIYKYFDLDLSESHRAKLYICTLLDPRFKKFNFWPTCKYVNNSQLSTECI